MAGCFVFAAVFDSATARERERAKERERTELNLERENEPVLALAVMEPGDLQPLTVYNEHAPCAHGRRHPQQPFGVQKEAMGKGGGRGWWSGDAGGDARGHPWVHSPCCGSTSLCRVLICGVPAMWSHQREREMTTGKEGKEGRRKEREEVVAADLVCYYSPAPRESILTK